MLILSTQRLGTNSRVRGRTVFDDLIGLAIGDSRIVADNLARLIIGGVSIGAFIGAGDQLHFYISVLDKDISYDNLSSLFFLASSALSDLFL